MPPTDPKIAVNTC